MIVEIVAGALRVGRFVAGLESELFRVFSTRGPQVPVVKALPPGIDALAIEADGGSARTYALISGSTALCSAEVWWGETYRQRRNYFRLSESEAELVHLKTDQAARGRGLASYLLAQVAQDMPNAGLTQLKARIWHSNAPSVRAFQKAGWRESSMRVDLRRKSWNRTFETHWG